MSLKTLANLILFAFGVVLTLLLIYGVVGVARIWADSQSFSLSTTHRIGVTVLGLFVALLLIGFFSKLVLQGGRFQLTKEQLNEISETLSVSYPVKKLLDSVNPVDYTTFESGFDEFCSTLDNSCEGSEWKQQQVRELEATVKSKYTLYRDHVTLGVARLSTRYRWLPSPQDSLLRAIALSSDLGSLGQFLVYASRFEHKLAGIAAIKYEHEYARSRLANGPENPKNIPELIQRSQKLNLPKTSVRPPHGRKREDFLKVYQEQQVPV